MSQSLSSPIGRLYSGSFIFKGRIENLAAFPAASGCFPAPHGSAIDFEAVTFPVFPQGSGIVLAQLESADNVFEYVIIASWTGLVIRTMFAINFSVNRINISVNDGAKFADGAFERLDSRQQFVRHLFFTPRLKRDTSLPSGPAE